MDRTRPDFHPRRCLVRSFWFRRLALGMALAALATVRGAAAAPPASAPSAVERWGMFDLALPGPADGNPFVDVALTARFTREHESFDVHGFYDGGGPYR